MDIYHYTLFLIFSIIAIMIVIDANVGDYIILLTKLMSSSLRKYIWILKYHPKNPIMNWIKYRESLRLAEELMKELENKDNKML